MPYPRWNANLRVRLWLNPTWAERVSVLADSLPGITRCSQPTPAETADFFVKRFSIDADAEDDRTNAESTA